MTTNVHEVPLLPLTPAATDTPSTTVVEPLSKNTSELKQQPCLFFLKGTCMFGEDCDFSHTVTPTEKIPVCLHFLKGRCKFGSDKCIYKHEYPPQVISQTSNITPASLSSSSLSTSSHPHNNITQQSASTTSSRFEKPNSYRNATKPSNSYSSVVPNNATKNQVPTKITTTSSKSQQKKVEQTTLQKVKICDKCDGYLVNTGTNCPFCEMDQTLS